MEKAHLYEALYLVNHGIDEAVRGVQRLKKWPKLFMETYHKSMAGLERRHAIINLQFMLEMRKLEEDDECRFEEEYNVWLSGEPLTNDEICQLMREVERQRKQEGKHRWFSFSPHANDQGKHEEKTERSTPAANQMAHQHRMQSSRTECQRRLMSKKRKVVWVGGTPVTPISARERKNIKKAIKKRYDRYRRKYPEVQGKVVDFITHSIEDGTLYIGIRFKDKTDFSLRYGCDMFIVGADICDVRTGDYEVIREYMRPIPR